jgi:hypothetical protein
MTTDWTTTPGTTGAEPGGSSFGRASPLSMEGGIGGGRGTSTFIWNAAAGSRVSPPFRFARGRRSGDASVSRAQSHFATGSIPFALITPFAAGVRRKSINALPASASLAVVPIAAEKTKFPCNSPGNEPTIARPDTAMSS